MAVEVHHSLPSSKLLSSSEWKVRIEGRLIGGQTEEEQLSSPEKYENKRFLNFFERAKI